MFTHCLSCKVRFQEPGVLDPSIRGDRIAYDPERGRLWSICRTCRSWSLAPIEERWEVVEELERLTTLDRTTGRPRLLSRTDNIALFQLGRVRIVRVGKAERSEEAWWRYGQRLNERWQDQKRVTVGGAAAVGAAIVGGVLSTTLPARYAFRSPLEIRRWLRFGHCAWSGRARCPLCDHPFSELSFFDRTIVRLRSLGQEELGHGLCRRCPRCGDAHEGGLHLQGLEAEQTLCRILAYDHYPGVPERQIHAAIDLLDREGGPSQLVSLFTRYTNQLGDLPRSAAVALEVATNEARERRLLRLEVAALQQHWREAESLASIVDGELTTISGAEQLRLRAAQSL